MSKDSDEDLDSEAAYIRDCAKRCRCCIECSEVPCEGCLGGGVCDAFVCCCDGDPYGVYGEDDDPYGVYDGDE